MSPQHFGDDEDQVGCRRALGQAAAKADPDHVRHRLVQRLAEQDRLGFDPPDAEPEDAKAVDHGRVRIGADEGVREGDPAAVAVVAVVDHGGQELEVDLVNDPGPRGHDAEITKGGLSPAQQLVPLAVSLVFPAHIERERGRRAEPVDLHGVVDHQVGWDQRVDLGRIATEAGHGVAHDGEIDDGGDAGEILEHHPRRHERDVGLCGLTRSPGAQPFHVVACDDPAAGVAEYVLEQDLDRHRRPTEVDSVCQRVQPVIGQGMGTGGQGAARAERIGRIGVGSSSCHRGTPPVVNRGDPRASRRRTGAPVLGRDRWRV